MLTIPITLRQSVRLKLDPDVAKQLGLPNDVSYKKGLNQIPVPLSTHWAIRSNQVNPPATPTNG